MKIVNIAPCAPYNEGWGYQDNLLPKYQAKNGNEVTLIITNKTNVDGYLEETECKSYRSNDGFDVVLKKKTHFLNKKVSDFLSLIDVYDDLVRIEPDLVFCHGLSTLTILQVVKYKRNINPRVVIVQDNHADDNIGPIQYGIIGATEKPFWRCIVRKAIPYVSRVYGVTPWRMEFANKYYGVPNEKIDLLIMGADDEKILFDKKEKQRDIIRQKYGIKQHDFVLITGGKLDKKKNVIELMKAISGNKNIKLIIFGNVLRDIKIEFDRLLEENENIIYIGWIDADQVYNYYFAADLAVFPGQHSVLWEQACAAKIPAIFKKWDGMHHVNNGGNSDFLEDTSPEGMSYYLSNIVWSDKYYKMKENACSEKTDIFLYSKIALKSVECGEEYN